MPAWRCTQWVMAAVLASALVGPAAARGAATTRVALVPPKLVGVWHKNLTQAEWTRVGVSRPVGVFTIVIKRTGRLIVYLPGDYRARIPDFVTTITTTGARLRLGSVPVCSFNGTYGWVVSGRTLTLEPAADKSCPVRETLFGGRWKR